MTLQPCAQIGYTISIAYAALFQMPISGIKGRYIAELPEDIVAALSACTA